MIQFLEYFVFLYLFSYTDSFFSRYILSYLVFLLFEKIQKFLLQKYWDFSFSAGMDLLFDFESFQNHSTIVCCCILDKEPSEETLLKTKNNLLKEKEYYRLREILRKNFFFSYWVRDPNFKIDDHFIKMDEILKSEEELYNKMGEELSTPFPENRSKWYFKYYKLANGKFCSINKFHHTLVDGISLMSLFLHISEAENLKVVKYSKIGFLQWIYIYLSLPITIPYYLFKYLKRPHDKNKIHGFRLSGKKKVFTLTAKHSVDELKLISKKLGVSINDLFTSSLIESLHEYCQKNLNEDLKSMSMFLPVSLRGFPESTQTQILPLNNWMIPIFVDVKVYRDEDKGKVAKKYGEMLSKLKNSYEAPALFLISHYGPKLIPTFLYRLFIEFNSLMPTFGFTNVPGPLNQMKMMGMTVENMFFYVPTVSNIGVGFSLMTYNNLVNIGVQADESTGIEPQKFAKLYDEMLEKYICQVRDIGNGVKKENAKKLN